MKFLKSEILGQVKIKINEHSFPMIGFGTYPLQGEICERAVLQAFHEGYRMFDTATMYHNFEAIAKALTSINRSEILITSKVWHDSQHEKKLLSDINRTLETLKIDYLDFYLLHWPNSEVPLEEIISTLKVIMAKGWVRHVGLSNVNIHHVRKALEKGMPVSAVQNEMNPHFFDETLVNFCHQNNILMQAWGPLARGRINQCSYILDLAKKYNKTPAQIALRWIIQLGCVAFPGSKNPTHIQENFAIHDFELTQADRDLITTQARAGERERVALSRGLGFSDEFDFSYDQCWPL